jgi:hypothetical protein
MKPLRSSFATLQHLSTISKWRFPKSLWVPPNHPVITDEPFSLEAYGFGDPPWLQKPPMDHWNCWAPRSECANLHLLSLHAPSVSNFLDDCDPRKFLLSQLQAVSGNWILDWESIPAFRGWFVSINSCYRDWFLILVNLKDHPSHVDDQAIELGGLLNMPR